MSLGYRATGTAVVLAQRIESVAPPGGVMLSESTARLVQGRTVLAEPECRRIKGSDDPVWVRQLLATRPRAGVASPAGASLVGRRPEMAALDALMERAIGGQGGVVGLVGQPGIGKSRVAREVAALAASRGLDVIWAFCESHAADVSFHVVAQLLRAAFGVIGSDADDARARVRTELPDAYDEDLLLIDDLSVFPIRVSSRRRSTRMRDGVASLR